MQAGRIMLEWNAAGEMDIKTSLPVASAENKKLLIAVLLDAAKALNDTGMSLELPPFGARRILVGGS